MKLKKKRRNSSNELPMSADGELSTKMPQIFLIFEIDIDTGKKWCT